MTGDGRVRTPPAHSFMMSYWTEQDATGRVLDRDRHPGEDYEALPDDADRPSELTIRPRYAGDTTTAWISADINDVATLEDSR